MKHSSVRSQLVYWVKADLHNLYDLKIGDPTKVARQVEYLLEGDRYQCDPKGYEVCFNESNGGRKWCVKNLTKRFTSQHLRLRFLAPQIVTIIYGKYYAGRRMRGSVDKGFKEKINGSFLCLISAVICHTLRAWQTGTYVEPRDFKRETSLGM
jgi:hypothetical protein